MISVGIVSVQKKRRSLFDVNTDGIAFKEQFGDEVVFVPVEISSVFSSKSIVGRRLLRKRIVKAESIFKSMGVDIVAYTKECDLIRKVDSGVYCDKSGIPLDELLNCFVICAHKFGVRFGKGKLVITDKNLKLVDFDFFSNLCMYAENIVLKTDCVTEAEKIAEEVFFEFGVWIEVDKYEIPFKLTPATLIVDADRGRIRIGDLTVDGIDYGIDCRGYDINVQEVIKKIKLYNKIPIKNIISGNNIIKIS